MSSIRTSGPSARSLRGSDPGSWVSAFVFSLVVLIAGMSSAMAGEFFERNGIAIDGYDPVAYFTQNAAVKGDERYSAQWQESVFHFASSEHRDLFVANPEKYAPQYRGFCAYGVSQGAKVKIEGERFAVVDGKLYLNYDESVQNTWVKDIPGYIKLADEKWPEVR